MQSSLTILAGSSPAAKHLFLTPVKGEYQVQTPKPDLLYQGAEVPVSSLQELAQLLDRASQDPTLLLVRGQLRPGLQQPFRRQHKGEEPALLPCPRPWILLDLDRFLPDLAPASFAADPAGYAAKARAQLPPSWARAACWWQATGSAGVKPGARLRLAFWLDRALSDTECKLLELGIPVDRSLFSPSQPHFIARPTLAPGVQDPIPGPRSGLLPGEAQVCLADPAEPAREALDAALARLKRTPEGERRTRLNQLAYKLALAHGSTLPPETQELLARQALLTGLDSQEAHQTVKQALEDGRARHEYEHEGWRANLARSKEGAIWETAANVALLAQHSPDLAGRLGWDTRTHQSVWVAPSPWGSTGPLSEQDGIQFLVWLQARAGMHVNHKSWALDALELAARAHPIDRLSQFLAELPPWDGQDRASTFFSRHWGAPDTPLTRAQAQAWFVQAVRRAQATLTSPVQADYLLVLVGAQGLRKSTGLAALMPSPEWFCDSLGDFRDKDTLQKLGRFWLVELAEMTQRRADQDAFKAFLSAQVDCFRPPYGRYAQEHARHCVFIGTANPDLHGTLTDSTGSRRFWVQEVTRQADADAIRAERQQLWAEALARASRGEQAWLTPELELESARANEPHTDQTRETIVQAYQDRLESLLRAPAQGSFEPWQLDQARRIQGLKTSQLMDFGGVEWKHIAEANEAMRRLGWGKVYRRHDRRQIRYWAPGPEWAETLVISQSN